MKAPVVLFSLLSLVGIVSAQYFSSGWAPGQPIPSSNPEAGYVARPSPPDMKQESNSPPKPSFLDTLVTLGPVGALSSLVGLNLSGAANINWDGRIPLITDENYGEMIVNENMTPEEEQERVWFLIITVTAGQPEGVSKFVDNIFDATYNYTLAKGDLSHVRFGRIDYLNVTSITTKWAVWSAPYLVVLKDRGQSLRFYKAGQIRLTEEVLYHFLKEDAWKSKEPWKTVWAPGGEREFVLDYLALVLSKVYGTLVVVPKWVMYVLSGGVASLVINFLHKPSSAPETVTDAKAVSTPPEPVSSPPVSKSSGSNSRGASKRKGKK
ncbi:hypothetical protein BJ138DRAFT_1082587 [Hygrophoropsis aurantiaca]|uniref:Uncharacterized protein n=1 Tax=Hygrophoropsis aurantiaca TaxID=72124 RepID=A0ACB8AJ48_9AGAM|nr:hypothetical protein BJ138DRAFT_1082587 [Hygrophoropsis aurantiaca]